MPSISRRHPATWVLAVVAVGALWFLSRQPYASHPWQTHPERISYCGRDLAPKEMRSRYQVPCTVELYLEVGPGRYARYGLVGGP